MAGKESEGKETKRAIGKRGDVLNNPPRVVNINGSSATTAMFQCQYTME